MLVVVAAIWLPPRLASAQVDPEDELMEFEEELDEEPAGRHDVGRDEVPGAPALLRPPPEIAPEVPDGKSAGEVEEGGTPQSPAVHRPPSETLPETPDGRSLAHIERLRLLGMSPEEIPYYQESGYTLTDY